jgi:transposase
MSDTIKIGMDLGDKYHIAVVFDAKGNELEVGKVINTKAGIRKYFTRYKGSTVAIEAPAIRL